MYDKKSMKWALCVDLNCEGVIKQGRVNFELIFSEVVLGEHVVGTDPDCSRKTPTFCNPKKITRIVDIKKDVIVHENYATPKRYSNDIALIRINEAIPLHEEDPTISAVSPICLPWSKTEGFICMSLDIIHSDKRYLHLQKKF